MNRRDRGPALLRCERCRAWTKHQFAAEKSTREKAFVKEIYRCGVCDEERVWGLGMRPREYAALMRQIGGPVAFVDTGTVDAAVSAEG